MGNIFVTNGKKCSSSAPWPRYRGRRARSSYWQRRSGDLAWLASDILSQAEHDELAPSILITTSHRMAITVKKRFSSNARSLEKRRIAEASSKIRPHQQCEGFRRALRISNTLAPETFGTLRQETKEFARKNPTNAGAIFLGHFLEACERLSLRRTRPLCRQEARRFSSPLNPTDFVETLERGGIHGKRR